MEKKKVSFWDYTSTFVSWRKTIIINFIIICFITAIITLIIPKTFTAETTILPPSGDEAGLGLAQMLGNLPLGALGMGMGSEEASIFLAILDSRTVMENIVNRFNLMEVYDIESMEKTIKELRGRVSVELNDEGTITLSASHKTGYFSGEKGDNEAREMAKKLANAFIDELDKVNSRIKTEKARNNRIFLEKRYQQNLADMEKAEENLKEFQQKYGVIALPEQTVASIEAGAELQAQVMLKEIEVKVLGSYVSKSHSDYVRAKTELQELRNKLNEMKYGVDGNDFVNNAKNDDLFIPFNQVPEVGVKYFRLMREYTIQEKLMEFLLPELEQAKIQEMRDTPTVQVLDPAVEPERKSSPKRMIIVALAGFLTVTFFLMFAYIKVNMEAINEADPERYQQINTVLYQLNPKRWFK
ncbi:hypothetical protein GF337_08310 [candidate division KSB1 bacterium]|nr:hypothetical protein [candidate division KSB1 bacterium]